MGQFYYWATHRSPDVSEALNIVNGTIADMKSYSCQVHDIRHSYRHYDLDNHAFQVLKLSSSLLPPQRLALDPLAFNNPKLLRDHYYPELIAALSTTLAPRSIIPFNAVVRQSSDSLNMGTRSNKPFFTVHCDYSHAGSREVLRNVAPSFFKDLELDSIISELQQAEFFRLREEILSHESRNITDSGAASHLDWDGSNYSGPRWSIYSIWRPLETVKCDPLAVLNPQTSFTAPDFHLGHYNNNCEHNSPTSIFPHGRSFMQVRLPHKNIPGFHPDYENQNIMPLSPDTSGYKEQLQEEGKQHQWLYLEEQEPEEVLVLKVFDSEAWVKDKRGTVMPGAGHSAFKLPNQDRSVGRRSVEVRFIMVY